MHVSLFCFCLFVDVALNTFISCRVTCNFHVASRFMIWQHSLFVFLSSYCVSV